MTRWGQYELEELVAQGSTGQVFRARHVELRSLAAVKVLRSELRSDPRVMERFRQEARILAGLDHPSIVRVLDIGLDDEHVWMALEWVDGAPLDDVLTARGPLTAQQAVGVIRHALQGLEEAHRRGVVHGDVATSNVLLSVAGQSMLVDFGLACPVGSTAVCGTPAFVSPEGASGGVLTPRSDVWSSAAVLHLLLTGKPVLAAKDVNSVLRRHRDDEAPPLRGHGEHLAGVLATALARDPVRRYPEAGAFLRALEEAAERRFGAGWLPAASVAGLAAGVGLAALGVTGGAAVAAAAPTAVVGSSVSAAVDTGPLAPAADPQPAPQPRPPRRPRRRPRTPKAQAALAAVVGIAVVAGTAVAVTRGADDLVSDRRPVDPFALVTGGPLFEPTGQPSDPSDNLISASTSTFGGGAFTARLNCRDGVSQVSSASAIFTTAGSSRQIPLVFVGSNVWQADTRSLPDDAGGGSGATYTGSCGEATPPAQPDGLFQSRLSGEPPRNPDGQATTLRVVAAPEPGIEVCPYGAPAATAFWVHGYAADSTDFISGFDLGQQDGMTATPMTAVGDGTFVHEIAAQAYQDESSRQVEGKNYTQTFYGSCDFTRAESDPQARAASPPEAVG